MFEIFVGDEFNWMGLDINRYVIIEECNSFGMYFLCVLDKVKLVVVILDNY